MPGQVVGTLAASILIHTLHYSWLYKYRLIYVRVQGSSSWAYIASQAEKLQLKSWTEKNWANQF